MQLAPKKIETRKLGCFIQSIQLSVNTHMPHLSVALSLSNLLVPSLSQPATWCMQSGCVIALIKCLHINYLVALDEQSL